MDKMSATIREASIVKIAQLGEAFLAGINPLGTTTVELGEEAGEEAYTPMQAAGMLGGLVGGGVLIPGAISGALGLARGLSERRTPGMPGATGAPTLAQSFWRGATEPFKDLYSGIKGYRTLSNYARTGMPLTAAQQKQMSDLLMRNTSLHDAAKAFKGMGTWDKMKAGLGALRGKTPTLTRSMAQSALPQLRQGLFSGGMMLGAPAALAALAAYTQYRLGQRQRRKQKEREQAMQMQAQGGYYGR